MKKDKTDSGDSLLSIPAGVFLLFYDLYHILAAVFIIAEKSPADLDDALSCLLALLIIAAAVFLFFRNARATGILISAVAVLIIIIYGALALNILDGAIEAEGMAPGGTVFVSVSRWLAAFPIGEILAWTFLSLSLFLRGTTAMILTLLSAVSEAVSCYFSFLFSGYFQGHPTPLSLFLPIFFIAAALCIGSWRRAAGLRAKDNPERP